MRLTAALIVGMMLLCHLTAAQEQPNVLKNGDFEAGLKAWTIHGDVTINTSNSLQGKPSVHIGPGAGVVFQRYRIGGLKIAYFSAFLRSNTVPIGGSVQTACYDAHGHLLMKFHQELDIKKAVGGVNAGIYFKTHALTAYIVVSIEKDARDRGYLDANSAVLNDYDRGVKRHAPLCNLEHYMLPFWKGKIVYNETVLLLSRHGEPARGRLMYFPRSIISVRDYALGTTYQPGRDYKLNGSVITLTPNSRIPFMRDTDFLKGDLKWYNLLGKHVAVTYLHDDGWKGPVPSYRGGQMPNTIALLTRRAPLAIAATGDSITLGTGTSGESHISPYMPTWAELFTYQLKRIYGDRAIRMYNTALGGMTSDWGRDTASGAVASLHPDLVLIAFGMNDFWWMPERRFHNNIQAIIDKVRAVNPNAEFILIGSMRYDPAYAQEAENRARMVSYIAALHSLVGKGVIELNMDAISGELAKLKKPKDLLSNPLHPNDFLARWYAQALTALLDKNAIPVIKADEKDSQRVQTSRLH